MSKKKRKSIERAASRERENAGDVLSPTGGPVQTMSPPHDTDVDDAKQKLPKTSSKTPIRDSDSRAFFDPSKTSSFEDVENGFMVDVVDEPSSAYAPKKTTASWTEAIEDGFKTVTPEDCAHWLFFPHPPNVFQSRIFERKCFARKCSETSKSGYQDLLTSDDIKAWLKEKKMTYGTNVDVTSYKGGVRRTHNANDGFSNVSKTADYETVMKRFEEDGCSIRILHPQRWSDKLWALLSNLENFWQSPTGCNAYWTPANSQGFAPHWDDIDAFVLQIEGRKRWRLYPTRDVSEKFPRFSSAEFSKEERKRLEESKYVEIILEPGDLMYMPRGTIHEAFCIANDDDEEGKGDDEASLHLTISVNQRNTFADILEHVFSDALADAVNTNVELRRCPPRDFLRNLTRLDETDANFRSSKKLLERCCNVVVENMMKNNVFAGSVEKLLGNLMRERVRPPKAHTRLTKASLGAKPSLSSKIGLVQKNCASLEDCDDGIVRLRTYINNDRKLHMEGASADILDVNAYREASSCMKVDPEIEGDDLDALATVLYAKYEDGVEVKDLPFDTDEEKIAFARRLLDTNAFCIL
tara:strand:+ start:181 stop:1926 length:1746 start_codon:yes stop_codon:yes gene_type:complete